MARPDPRGRDMLRTYRRAMSRPGEHREALWARIEASLDAGAPGPGLEPASSGGPPSVTARPWHASGWVTTAAVAAAAVAAIVVAVVTLAPERRDEEPSRAPSTAPHEVAPREPAEIAPRGAPAAERSVEASRAEASRASSQPVEATPEPGAASPRRRSARSTERGPAAAPAGPSTEDDELRAEMALIREARQALRDDRPAGALEVLDAHARAFPHGQMREDREVLRIEALCATGRAPQARAEVRLFLRAFPESAHAQRVRTMCTEP